MGDYADYLTEQGEEGWYLHLSGRCGEYGCQYCEEDYIEEEKRTTMKTGIINNIAIKETATYTNYRFEIDGVWYGVFKNAGNAESLDAVGKGDKVSFEPIQKGQYWNLKDIKVEDKATPQQVAVIENKNQEKENRIYYSGLMKCAVELTGITLSHMTVPKKDVPEFVVSGTSIVPRA